MNANLLCSGFGPTTTVLMAGSTAVVGNKYSSCCLSNNYIEALRKKVYKAGGKIIVTDVRPGLVDTAMAKGEGLFWVMPVENVARQICAAIRRKKSKVYVTKRWHILAVINKNLPFCLFKRI